MARETVAEIAGGVKVMSDDKFVQIPLDQIVVVDRPEAGQEHNKLFFNPRHLDSFDDEEMLKLCNSIRADGLQQPMVVRTIGKGKKIEKVQLIAGERRFRSLTRIVQENLPCFDDHMPQQKSYKLGQTVICRGRFGKVIDCTESVVKIQLLDDHNRLTDVQKEMAIKDVYPTVPGSILYGKSPCRVIYDCPDERALRLAFTDNDKHKGFRISEEIALVERLLRRGLKQGDIADLLGTNETWVSHTLNFRDSLPPEAFQRLVSGQLTRNVAVNLLSFRPEDRSALFAEAIKEERLESESLVNRHRERKEQAEDEEELAHYEAVRAAGSGDTKAAERENRKAKAAELKAAKAKEKLERAQKEVGHIKQSHVQRAAAKAGISPKKAKMLSRDLVEQLYIDNLKEYKSGELDPVCQQAIPEDCLDLMISTARAIICGERDVLKVLREFLIKHHGWTIPESPDDDDCDDDCGDDDFEDDYDPSLDFKDYQEMDDED